MLPGKEEFYAKARDALTKCGYVYYDGDLDIKGKGRSHRAKPDYIACKGNKIIIGEIKSPAESPQSSSWRMPQPGDGEAFRKVRSRVVERERRGLIASEVGGHEIIILGQLPDYLEKCGITYDFPFQVNGGEEYYFAYTFPVVQCDNVYLALKNCGRSIEGRLDVGNGAMTFIFR